MALHEEKKGDAECGLFYYKISWERSEFEGAGHGQKDGSRGKVTFAIVEKLVFTEKDAVSINEDSLQISLHSIYAQTGFLPADNPDEGEMILVRRSRRIPWGKDAFLEAFVYKPNPEVSLGRVHACLGDSHHWLFLKTVAEHATNPLLSAALSISILPAEIASHLRTIQEAENLGKHKVVLVALSCFHAVVRDSLTPTNFPAPTPAQPTKLTEDAYKAWQKQHATVTKQNIVFYLRNVIAWHCVSIRPSQTLLFWLAKALGPLQALSDSESVDEQAFVMAASELLQPQMNTVKQSHSIQARGIISLLLDSTQSENALPEMFLYHATAQTLRIAQEVVKNAVLNSSAGAFFNRPLIVNLSENGFGGSGFDHAGILYDTIKDNSLSIRSKSGNSRRIPETPQADGHIRLTLPPEIQEAHSPVPCQIHLQSDSSLSAKFMRLKISGNRGFLLLSAHSIDDDGVALCHGPGSLGLALTAKYCNCDVFVVCRFEEVGGNAGSDLEPRSPALLAASWSEDPQRRKFLSEAYRSGCLKVLDFQFDVIGSEFVTLYLTEFGPMNGDDFRKHAKERAAHIAGSLWVD